MLGPFNLKKLNNDQYLLTNDLGLYCFLTEVELNKFIHEKLEPDSNIYENLRRNYFIIDSLKTYYIEEMSHKLRTSKNYLFSSTDLHIFVVTNYCNSNCIYCQAQSNSINKSQMMDKDTAKHAVDLALQSPKDSLTFEFQGGEPLSNFEIIKYIVEYTESIKGDKSITYNVVTNLFLLNEEILEFFIQNNVCISTSLDGDEEVHCFNRPLGEHSNSFKLLMEKVNMISSRGLNYGAIQTTTRYSLNRYKQIIDTYISLNLENIFIRPLTPLGCALDGWDDIGYTTEEFLEFYKKSLQYLIEINKSGTYISEGHARILLSKIINGIGINFMELRSPCGGAIGQITYYYDGNVFTCDEARMLYEMGDDSFKIGNVFSDSYDDLMESDICKTICKSSILETLPRCHECVYQSYCGTCPVINYALEGDVVSRQYSNYRCKIYEGMLDIIFELLSDDTNKDILESWVG